MLYCSKLRKRYSHLTGTTQDNNWQTGNSLADNHRTSCKKSRLYENLGIA